ncbi:RcnB family protein [Novosphingobium sp.]|jgi:hypothetical protein|uniref:RcnB family protein n=1 Tax=Novosphingobium sp. TaxID=1874826 RepID=UPI002FE0B099
MTKEHTLKAKKLLSAAALGAMAIAAAGLAVPTAAMAEPRQERAWGQGRDRGEGRGGNGGANRPAPQPRTEVARPEVQRPQAPERAQRPSAWRGGGDRPQPQSRPQPGPQPQAQPQQGRPAPTQQGGRAWGNDRPDRSPAQGQPSWKSGNRWQNNGSQSGWQGSRGNDDRRWSAGNRPDRPDRPDVRPGDNRPDGRPGWNNNNDNRPDRNAWGKVRPNDDRRGDDRRWNNNDNRPDRNAWGRDRRNDDRRWAGNDNRRWDRSDWRRDNRYDWQHYRDRNRSVYRMGGYYAPYRGYSYRRLSIGFSLGSLFYGSNYWINDPWEYRLPPVYGPYRWVRYYDDVLLVDVYSGEVVDVIYDFFW